MSACAAAGAGFLLAVLWFDLMFDVQVLGRAQRGRERDGLADETLASIAAYYRRVTTAARPMNRLVAAVMLATTASIVVEVANGTYGGWVPWASLGLILPAIGLAGAHTVPSAVRLGARGDSIQRQSVLARSICRDHLICVALIVGLLVLQLGFA